MLDFLKQRPTQESHIDLPNVTVEINHALRTVFMFVNDTEVPDDAFEQLETHLKKRGYFLQVFTAQPVRVADRRNPPEVTNANR